MPIKTIILLLFGFMNIQMNHFPAYNQTSTLLNNPVMVTQVQDTLTIEQYGQKIANLFYESDWEGILNEIHPVNLPGGWEGQVKSLFESYFGKKFEVEIIAVGEMPQYLLNMLKKAPPEVLEHTPNAIELSYDNSTEDEVDKGTFNMAVYQKDGNYSILLVGG